MVADDLEGDVVARDAHPLAEDLFREEGDIGAPSLDPVGGDDEIRGAAADIQGGKAEVVLQTEPGAVLEDLFRARRARRRRMPLPIGETIRPSKTTSATTPLRTDSFSLILRPMSPRFAIRPGSRWQIERLLEFRSAIVGCS